MEKEAHYFAMAHWARHGARLSATAVSSLGAHHGYTSERLQCEQAPDSFPDFSRYPEALNIARYLTRDIYQNLSSRKTSNGVTLECLIQAAVALPHGSMPPQGIAGVYAGDAETYVVFHELLDPIIRDYHGVPKDVVPEGDEQVARRPSSTGVGLRRHRTNLSVHLLAKDQIDPKGDYILYTRIRLARSIRGFPFGPAISRAQRRQILALIQDCTRDRQEEGHFYPIMQLTNEQHDDLIQRRLVFRDPDAWALAAGTHRHWPDGRGVYFDCDPEHRTPSLIMWCNNEDHLWIISNSKGGNVQKVFARLSEGAQAMEASLRRRGHVFVEDARLGFLNSSPTNIGTGLRATVYVKLPLLGKQPGFDELVQKLRLEQRSDYSRQDKRYTGIFDMSNMESLGKSEVELINIMIKGVAKLIELEKLLEQGETIDLHDIQSDDRL